MLESIYIMLFIVAFILTILTVEYRNILYSMAGLMAWLILFVQSLWITDVAGTIYHEHGLSAFCLIFVFVHLVLSVIAFMDWRDQSRIP